MIMVPLKETVRNYLSEVDRQVIHWYIFVNLQPQITDVRAWRRWRELQMQNPGLE